MPEPGEDIASTGIPDPPEESGSQSVAPPERPERRAARPRTRASGSIEGQDLRIRLPPELHQRLRVQCQPSGWTPEELVVQMLRSLLPARTPAIFHADRLLASRDTCRFWSRNPLETSLRLISDQGTFLISTQTTSGGYRQWLDHFTTQGLPDPHREARQMRLIQLQGAVQSVEDFSPEDWRKQIPAEDYIVTEAMVSETAHGSGGGPQEAQG
ncbi:MAG: hypothetical protein ACO3I0_09370 [Limisphaerales bacterium]